MDWVGACLIGSYFGFGVLGFVVPRKRRHWVTCLAILLGVPFGFMLDIDPVYGADGPSCGWLGQPLAFLVFGCAGMLTRNVVDFIRRKLSPAKE